MKTNFKNNLAPAVIELNRMNEELQAENELLKAELKKWEDRSKVVKDGYDGEVYEWEDNYYIVTPHLNVFVKGLLKENAKLNCLALHLFSKYFFACYWNSEGLDPNKYLHLHEKYEDAYRKAKKELKEGK